MCGRFTLSADPIDIAERFNLALPFLDVYNKSYNIAPSQSLLAIINTESGRRGGLLRWGLIPSWAKDEKMGYKMINARSETVYEKPSYKSAFSKRRCLIIADGFYEWKRNNDTKQPMRITLKNQKLFAMAGLWEKWQSPNGNSIYSCTIITTKPNELVSDIHDRMPVILREQDEKIWLDYRIQDSELLKQVLQPYEADDMSAYAVSPLVNSPKNNSIDLITPYC